MMTSRELSREIAFKVQQFGIGGALKLGFRKLAQELWALGSTERKDEFDLRYGTDTDGVINVSSLDLPSNDVKHAVRYQTAMEDVFPAILRELPIRYEEFVFIDLGSGKGRALLLASSFPFKAIIGVELAPSLHRIACNNIARYRSTSQRCYNITTVCDNANSYPIPGGNLVLYLFNPFDEQIIQPLLSNIEASLRQSPRSIYILYLKALHRSVFDRSSFLRIYKDTQRYVIYQSKFQDL